MRCTSSALQIFGGHGYIREHGMEQLVRDCRITPIYEGTNEVQAIDLVSRKLTGETGEFAIEFLQNWKQYLDAHSSDGGVAAYVGPTATALQHLTQATTWIQDNVHNDDAAARGAASQYLRLFALTIIACLWTQIMVAIRDRTGKFYDTKRKLANFYMRQVLPETASLHDTIATGDGALADFEVTDFSA